MHPCLAAAILSHLEEKELTFFVYFFGCQAAAVKHMFSSLVTGCMSAARKTGTLELHSDAGKERSGDADECSAPCRPLSHFALVMLRRCTLRTILSKMHGSGAPCSSHGPCFAHSAFARSSPPCMVAVLLTAWLSALGAATAKLHIRTLSKPCRRACRNNGRCYSYYSFPFLGQNSTSQNQRP